MDKSSASHRSLRYLGHERVDVNYQGENAELRGKSEIKTVLAGRIASSPRIRSPTISEVQNTTARRD